MFQTQEQSEPVGDKTKHFKKDVNRLVQLPQRVSLHTFCICVIAQYWTKFQKLLSAAVNQTQNDGDNTVPVEKSQSYPLKPRKDLAKGVDCCFLFRPVDVSTWASHGPPNWISLCVCEMQAQVPNHFCGFLFSKKTIIKDTRSSKTCLCISIGLRVCIPTVTISPPGQRPALLWAQGLKIICSSSSVFCTVSIHI